MERWNPPSKLSRREKLIIKRLQRTRKLFAFLRLHRHELMDGAFQEELEQMYRRTGAGAAPVPPALLCMALLLQAYLGTSDAEAVELTLLDLRWQLVLGCLGAEEPAFSQGALQQFRERLIVNDLDRRLLERTVELAKKTAEFDWKKLPKSLRIAVDSRPFDGAGRVEDTFNLLGHAARKLVQLAAELLEVSVEKVCAAAKTPLFAASSIKAGLDVDWSDPEQKDEALQILLTQVDALHRWLEREHLALEVPLQHYIEAVSQVRKQDLEVVKGNERMREGVAEDRRISIEDGQMRHGRKSKSKRFNGYKEHIATDLDSGLIRACAVTPANRPEEEAMPELQTDLQHQKVKVRELAVDRAYVNSSMARDVLANGGEVICKPWAARSRREQFSKTDFKINMRDRTLTCPAGEVERFEPGEVVEFDPDVCGACRLRAQCTKAASGRGRTVSISEDERLQQKLRKLQSTGTGRDRLRDRVGVEHRLAHIAARQGPKARYRGVRKNVFDLRRVAAIQNLETIQRKAAA